MRSSSSAAAAGGAVESSVRTAASVPPTTSQATAAGLRRTGTRGIYRTGCAVRQRDHARPLSRRDPLESSEQGEYSHRGGPVNTDSMQRPGPPARFHRDGGDLGVRNADLRGDPVHVPFFVWAITIAVTIAFFVYEFFAHVRRPHEPSLGEAARWSGFYIGLALLFGIVIGLVWGWDFGGEYYAGYLTEKELSVDNLFVFLIVMPGFAVPRMYQQKVLMIGLVIARILRGAFSALGATPIGNSSRIFPFS